MERKTAKWMGFLLLQTLVIWLLSGCTAQNAQKDIVILYTNDVHCAVDADIGYAGLAAYQKQIEQKNAQRHPGGLRRRPAGRCHWNSFPGRISGGYHE